MRKRPVASASSPGLTVVAGFAIEVLSSATEYGFHSETFQNRSSPPSALVAVYGSMMLTPYSRPGSRLDVLKGQPGTALSGGLRGSLFVHASSPVATQSG